MLELLQMYWGFFVIGGLTFGGGYSMLPMLKRVCIEQHHWTTESDLLDYFAIGQCIPGLIAVNTSLFIGYRHRRLPGALCAVLGVVTPSVLIIILIAMVLNNLMAYPVVGYAFAGIRIAVAALILSTIIGLCKTTTRNWIQILLCAASFVAVALFNISPIWVVVGAAVVGLLLREQVQKT